MAWGEVEMRCFNGRARVLALAGVGVAAMAMCGPASAEDWVAAGPEGCKMWNPFPEQNETIVWNGKCAKGFAEGQGQVVEKSSRPGGDVVAYGTWVGGRVHGDYYYEREGRTCYEQKLHGVAKQTVCVDTKGTPTIRAVDIQGRALEPMRPLTTDERGLYKVVIETIAAKSYRP